MRERRIPRIAWFTPLQPVASGISFYNEELLPLLAGSWSIDVFVDGYYPTHLRESRGLRVLPARRFRGLGPFRDCRRPTPRFLRRSKAPGCR